MKSKIPYIKPPTIMALFKDLKELNLKLLECEKNLSKKSICNTIDRIRVYYLQRKISKIRTKITEIKHNNK